jgi:hypothetical protein
MKERRCFYFSHAIYSSKLSSMSWQRHRTLRSASSALSSFIRLHASRNTSPLNNSPIPEQSYHFAASLFLVTITLLSLPVSNVPRKE